MGPAAPRASGEVAGERQKLLVVAPARFEDALGSYIQYRRGRLPVEFRSLESILRDSAGVDDPERLKRCLYKGWKEDGLHFVLLVGDADVLPVRYMVLDRITPTAFDFAFYPSDLYYADIAKQDGAFEDWNASKDGYHADYFGEVRGEKNKDDPINYDQIDYHPELAVGRWPVSTPEEVRGLAAKTIAFERQVAQRGDVPIRAALIAVGGWVDSRGRMDRYAQQLPEKWQIEKRYLTDARRNDGTRPPDKTELMALLNDGVDLLCHTGHGTDTSWAECLDLRDMGKIRNRARLPVMISAGCSTARFASLGPYEKYLDILDKEHQGTDAGEVFSAPPPPPKAYQAGVHNPPGLGEELLRRGANGAVACIGCNTGSQPCGLTLVEGFLRVGRIGATYTGRLLDRRGGFLLPARTAGQACSHRQLVSAKYFLSGHEVHGVW